MKYDYDLIILGSGPAGFSAAMQSTKFGKKVLLVEADAKHLGGAWINAGTVPSKALREAAASIYKYNQLFGSDNTNSKYHRYKMADLLRFKDQVVKYENSEVKRNLIKNEVHTARGMGYILDPHTVEVNDHLGKKKKYRATFILIATGSSATKPKNFEVDNRLVVDNRSLVNMTHVPKRLVIIGGGVNAIEYATIFSALGTKVNLLSSRESYLPFLDSEIKAEFARSLEQQRMVIHNQVYVEGVAENPLRNCTEVKYRSFKDNELKVLETEQVVHFGIRMPNTKGIGLEELGVEMDDEGYITVNDHYQTSVPSIYAAGDICGFPGLASASFTQGRIASCHMANVENVKLTGSHPFGIYTIPEMSSIGITEDEAKSRGLEYAVGRAYYKELTKSSVSNTTLGMLKLVIDRNSLKLLGVHVIGENACDIIHIGQAVMKNQVDVRYFVDNILNYPTYSEAYRVAAFNGLNRINKSGVKYRSLVSDEESK
ncbi:NAD(P) transhydrogenase [Cyclonatronum proteinivorum]|uniref:Soluble pyridine nucleotide transhydrogenase n=1 Tax=Cyclonatronum proteinivorum TaxID=1457365 RepID=A0A345UPY4_9BACT|nr:Si-specific NAD(P)(+) transhydrogenase [Cyclonatronum proteinivorum]AXJ02536.1 NAD(P) transhydrogenase [Cyclonatronum proteinivorum]